MSRAVVLTDFGVPVEVQAFPEPVPEPGGMVVRPSYGGICGTDIHLQRGHLPIPTPIVLGHEGLGVVDQLGAGGVTDANGEPLVPGDVVMWASSMACGRCEPCRQHREPTLCENRRTHGVNRAVAEEPLSGAWGEKILLPPGTTSVKVTDVDPVAAMAFACAGPTMVHALFDRRPVRVGETVIVQGSGPVGLAAAALAQLSGAARVVVVGGPANRLGQAKAAGIGDEHVDITAVADPEEALAHARDLVGGGGADLVIECAGVPVAVAQGLRLARRGGSYLIVGQYTDSGDTSINPHQIVYRQLDVIGSWAFTGAHLVEYVRLLPALTARFGLADLVTAFPLDQAARAMAEVAAGSVLKAVLEITP